MAAIHKGGHGLCSVCGHPNLRDINRVLAEGLSFDRTATMYGLSATSLRRHKQNHPDPALVMLQSGEPVEESPTPGSSGSEAITIAVRRASLKSQLREAARALRLAKASGSHMAVNAALREQRQAHEAINVFEDAQKRIEIAKHGGHAVNLLTTQAWVDARTAVMKILDDHDSRFHRGVDNQIRPEQSARIELSNALTVLEPKEKQ